MIISQLLRDMFSKVFGLSLSFVSAKYLLVLVGYGYTVYKFSNSLTCFTQTVYVCVFKYLYAY